MNDAQYVFQQEVRERKALARQARYVKKGSRSTRCPMPSDHYTAKQLRERNGELMSVNLAKPIPWKTFKKLSMDIQKEYVSRLIRQYGTNASDLSKVFGVTSTTVSAYCKDNDFDVNFRCGVKMPEHKRAAFGRFLECTEVRSELTAEKEIPEESPSGDVTASERAEDLPEPASQISASSQDEDLRETKSGGLQRFCLEFSAGSNLEGVFNSIRCIVGDRNDLHISVEGVFDT